MENHANGEVFRDPKYLKRSNKSSYNISDINSMCKNNLILKKDTKSKSKHDISKININQLKSLLNKYKNMIYNSKK